MIYVRLRGRAGNQLFIYAMARNLNITTGQPVTICTRLDNTKDTKFKIDLDEFKISEQIFFDEAFKFPWYANNDCLIIKLFRKIAPNITFKLLSKLNVFLWLGETYKEININCNKNAFLDGYWQSDKYFKNNYELIVKKEMIMKKNISSSNIALLNEIKRTESVCITIRRGDYFSNNNIKKMYYICDENYFSNAIKRMVELKPNAQFIVFSDDIEWVKKEIAFPNGTLYESGKDTIAEKLFLMSNCKNFIISNSSFSWWAQEMCDNNDKIVISPSIWYKDKRICDIFQENWIKI